MKRLELFRNRLYQKAKEDKERKFYTLHDKLCRIDILEEAWKNVAANHGTAGIDNQTIEDIRAYGIDRFLRELQQELINETYTVSDVKRVFIPKPDGKERPLGIPTIKDRIVQQAVKSIIEPIFEADFQEFSYAYRPKKSAKHASEEIRKYINYGCTNIIDIDLKGFFDNINHEKMMFFVSKRIADPYILKLIKEWLRAGIVYKGETTYPTLGTPQGGVISPLLANIYLNELDTLWVKKKMDERYGQNAHLIRYSDDAVILTDRDPQYAMDVLKRIISLLDLELNTEKTKITTAYEGFDFLGFHFIRKWSDYRKKEVTYVSPSDKAVRKFRENIKNTVPKQSSHRKTMTVAIQQVNAIIRGWYNYYKHTNAAHIFNKLQRFIEWKVAKYYCFIHKIPRVSSREGIYDKISDYGLISISGKIQYFRAA
ncbi:MAG: group II intron reverse transcriptase/maturase [Thermoplasmataceae archaeon]